MKPIIYKNPTGIKFAQDKRVDILDLQYNVKETAQKPGPGRYETHTDF